MSKATQDAQYVSTVRGDVKSPLTQPTVLLASATNWYSVSRIPRLLKMAGARVVVLCPPHTMVSATQFVDEFIFVAKDTAGICDEMLAHLHTAGNRYAWCMVGDDELFRETALRDDPILDSWFPIKRDEGARAFLQSKFVFMERCGERGLNVASFKICDSSEEAEALATEYGYPAILKKQVSTGASGVFRVDSAAQVREIVARVKPPVAVQRFVTGMPFATEAFFDRGRPIFWTTSEQINRFPGEMGPSSSRRLVNVPEMKHVLTVIGDITKFHGFGSVDSILPGDGGSPMVCEMNPRPTSGFFVDPQSTQRFADAVARMINGVEHPAFTPPTVEPRVVSFFPESVCYLLDEPGKPQRWKAAFNSLRNVPLDDRKLLGKFVSHCGSFFLTRHRVRNRLRQVVGKVTNAARAGERREG